MKTLDLVGQKFGRLTVTKYLCVEKNKNIWLCKCECGNLVKVNTGNLTSGNTKSCGCLQKQRASKSNIKHGKRNTRLYRIWLNMKDRCCNKHNKRYEYYGGRGIAVCNEWKDDFQAFYDWSMVNGYSDNLTIDRINVDGNYEHYNCRWVDMKTQRINARNTNNITIDGVTKCLKDWCVTLHLNYSTVHARINRLHWDIKKALNITKGDK